MLFDGTVETDAATYISGLYYSFGPATADTDQSWKLFGWSYIDVDEISLLSDFIGNFSHTPPFITTPARWHITWWQSLSLPSYMTNQRSNKEVSITVDQMQQIIIKQPASLQSFHLIKMADAEDQEQLISSKGLSSHPISNSPLVYSTKNSRLSEYYERGCTVDPKVCKILYVCNGRGLPKSSIKGTI